MERKLKVIWWGVLVILICGAIWKLFLPTGSKAYIDEVDATREIIVYVTGAVAQPGLIHLPLDARLNDALQQVTLLPNANLEALNPAERLKDGQKVVVPSWPEPAGSTEGLSQAGSTLNSESSVTAGGQGASTGIVTDGKININTASAEELDELPGIGPALAERIIQYRTENGAFALPEDLQNVSGIGPKTYEKMADLVKTWP